MYDDGEIPILEGKPVNVVGLIVVALLAIAGGVYGALWLVVQAVQ